MWVRLVPRMSAMRSLEIFVKETTLLPLLLEAATNTFGRRLASCLGSTEGHVWLGKWDRALRLVGQAYGPLAPMMTDSGEDVWSVWKNRVIPAGGDIVHGWVEAPSTEETTLVLLWAKQLMDQLRLRLIAAGKHPLHDLFVAALEPSYLKQPSSLGFRASQLFTQIKWGVGVFRHPLVNPVGRSRRIQEWTLAPSGVPGDEWHLGQRPNGTLRMISRRMPFRPV